MKAEPTTPPADLDAFWSQTLDRARGTALDATIEQVEEKVPYYKCRVTYKSLDGIPIRAYLTLPADPAEESRPHRWPAIITVPGYGGWEMTAMPGDCQRGCAVLQIFPRGMGESAELWSVPEGSYGAWITVGTHDPEGFYYQGAYIDMVRGLDYLLTRSDIDPDRIGVIGVSGGGLLALGHAAIDPRVKAVVAGQAALINFRHNEALASNKEASDPLFLRTWDYFEPLHLAPRISAPTLLTSGGLDRTCTAASIRLVYEKLPGIKALYHVPYMPHGTCRDYHAASWDWLGRYCIGAR